MGRSHNRWRNLRRLFENMGMRSQPRTRMNMRGWAHKTAPALWRMPVGDTTAGQILSCCHLRFVNNITQPVTKKAADGP
jgi:hypothetical protein